MKGYDVLVIILMAIASVLIIQDGVQAIQEDMLRIWGTVVYGSAAKFIGVLRIIIGTAFLISSIAWLYFSFPKILRHNK
jgi:hypothetical protein